MLLLIWTVELLMVFFQNSMKVTPSGTDGVLLLQHMDMDKCVSLLLRQCRPGPDPRMPGRKEGLRQRLKRLTRKQTRTSLASILLTNVCFLWNKLDEVQANVSGLTERIVWSTSKRPGLTKRLQTRSFPDWIRDSTEIGAGHREQPEETCSGLCVFYQWLGQNCFSQRLLLYHSPVLVNSGFLHCPTRGQ